MPHRTTAHLALGGRVSALQGLGVPIRSVDVIVGHEDS